MTRKSIVTQALGISAALLFSSGCEKADEQQAASGQEPSVPAEESAVDATDPKAVAQAFIAAIVRKNAGEAGKYVAPHQAEEWTKALEEGMPPLPADPEIQVRVKENGVQADVRLVNAEEPPSGPPFGLDLELIDGKWWVVK